jgi:hypothetical protein
MNSTGRHGEKSSYLVILLLVVGLTAFSHSVKELTEIHQLTLDASRLIAHWSGSVTPAEIPQTVVRIEKIEKLESCESRQSAPSIALSWLNETPEPPSVRGAVAPVRKQQLNTQLVRRPFNAHPSEEIAKLKKLQRFGIDLDAFEVRVSTDDQNTDSDGPVTPELPSFTFKAKPRKSGGTRMNPRDREMLLKTLNRSINLRIAS